MSELPDWFKLSDYQQEKSLEDWSYEVWVRAKLFYHLPWKNNFSIREDKIDFFNSFVAKREMFRPQFKQHAEYYYEGAYSSKPISIISDMGDLKYCEQEDFCEKDEIELWLHTQSPIQINLECTDEQLMTAFKEYLKLRRDDELEFYSLAKSIDSNLSKWSEINLMPLFDLLYWKAAVDKKLTYTVIGDAIWPSDLIGLEQRVRKQGLPMIERVFSDSVAKILYQKSRNGGKK